jgi:DNA-binding SARP family transcriptional activator
VGAERGSSRVDRVAQRPLIAWRDADGVERAFELETAPALVTIGRDDECAIALSQDLRVSRMHARLDRVGSAWTVTDAGSTNGTFINRDALHSTRRLVDGDILQLGDTTLTVHLPGRTASIPTQGATGAPRGIAVARAHVVVTLCGPLTLHVDGRRLETQLSGRIGRRLFAYLVTKRARAARRDELAAVLWPRDPPASPEAGLSTHLARLRRLLGEHAVVGRGHVRIDLGADAYVDVDAAESWASQAQRTLAAGSATEAIGAARAALGVLEQGFLPEEEDEWAAERRAELEGLVPQLLETEAAAALTLGGAELPAAERAARKLVDLEPYHEAGYRLLMRAHAERGNPAEALHVYEGLRHRLSESLGVPPSVQTRSLHEALLAETTGGGAPPG